MVVIFDREQHKCDYFLNDYLAFSNQVHFFFFFFLAHSDFRKGHRVLYHSHKVTIFKISKLFFFFRSRAGVIKLDPGGPVCCRV